jgi:hypothetical protein
VAALADESHATLGARPRANAVAMVGFLPGIAALGVGVLYAAGALERATQLHGAHLRVLDFLPLIPLPDLLAVGVSQAVQGTLGVVIWAFLFAAVVWLSRAEPERLRPQIHMPRLQVMRSETSPATTKPSRLPQWTRAWPVRPLRWLFHLVFVSYYSWVFLYLVYCTFDDFASSASVTVASACAAHWPAAAENKQRGKALALVSTILISSVAFGLMRSYFVPAPLPKVSLDVAHASDVHGGLVVHVDRTWYVSDRPNRVISIPDSQVTAAVVVSQKNPRPRTGWQIIRSWF